MINLYFDKPKVNSLLSDDIDEVAINWGISHEAAVIKCFDVLVSSLGKHNAGGATYFDLLICECFKKKMLAPKITLKTHGNGTKLPMLKLHTDVALHEPTGRMLPITNQMLEHFGEAFSEEFEIEYFGYKRVGENLLFNTKTIANPVDMVYMLNGKTHIYDGINFIPVDRQG